MGLALADLTMAAVAVLALGGRALGPLLAIAVASVPAAYGLEAA